MDRVTGLDRGLARVVGRWTLADMPWVARCRVRRVHLKRSEVMAVVREWGRTDAARGRPVSDADLLPHPHRRAYLIGYRAVRRDAGR